MRKFYLILSVACLLFLVTLVGLVYQVYNDMQIRRYANEMLKCLQDNTVSNYDQYCRQWVKTAQVTGDAMTINSKEYDLKISCDLDAKNQRFECEGEPLEYFSTGFHTSLQPSSQLNK